MCVADDTRLGYIPDTHIRYLFKCRQTAVLCHGSVQSRLEALVNVLLRDSSGLPDLGHIDIHILLSELVFDHVFIVDKTGYSVLIYHLIVQRYILFFLYYAVIVRIVSGRFLIQGLLIGTYKRESVTVAADSSYGRIRLPLGLVVYGSLTSLKSDRDAVRSVALSVVSVCPYLPAGKSRKAYLGIDHDD